MPKDGLGLPAPLPPETRALAALALYQPRFVWPPDFRATHEWRVLREDIAEHGIRTPLRILRNGWVIDGTHRFLIAQELGLERVPVQVVPLSLGRAARGGALGARPTADRADGRPRGDRTAASDAASGGHPLPDPRRGPGVRLRQRGEPPRPEPGEPARGKSVRAPARGTDHRGTGAPVPDAPLADPAAPRAGRARRLGNPRAVQGRTAAAAASLRGPREVRNRTSSTRSASTWRGGSSS